MLGSSHAIRGRANVCVWAGGAQTELLAATRVAYREPGISHFFFHLLPHILHLHPTYIPAAAAACIMNAIVWRGAS